MAPVEKTSKSISVEDADLKELPGPTEEVHGNTKTLTVYDYDDNDKMIKIISHYRIEKRKVPKAIAVRKSWKKYGLSAGDKPGPNPATTIAAEEVTMQFLTPHGDEEEGEDELKKKLADTERGQVKCRICKGDHWTPRCPYRDQLDPLGQAMGEEKDEEGPEPSGPPKGLGGVGGGKYIPPSMREGASKRGEAMGMRTRDETTTVRVTNLSETTQEKDLDELFSRFGDIVRIYLAKDKATGVSKGFAFINYKRREEADAAIKSLDGHGYDHLILNVEWARPSGKEQ